MNVFNGDEMPRLISVTRPRGIAGSRGKPYPPFALSLLNGRAQAFFAIRREAEVVELARSSFDKLRFFDVLRAIGQIGQLR